MSNVSDFRAGIQQAGAAKQFSGFLAFEIFIFPIAVGLLCHSFLVGILGFLGLSILMCIPNCAAFVSMGFSLYWAVFFGEAFYQFGSGWIYAIIAGVFAFIIALGLNEWGSQYFNDLGA